MTVPGDVVEGISNVSPNAIFDIKPQNVGEQWVIHNLYFNNGTVEIYKTDGNIFLLFDDDTTKGGRFGASYHVTNTLWIQMKNTGTADMIFSFDGVQTK